MDHREKQDGSPVVVKDLRIKGDKTTINVVQAFEEKKREWLVGQPVCELLAHYYINHTGVMQAHYPFEISRANQSGTFMLACYAGEGRVLADGKWIKVKAGEACLLPPFVANAMKCMEGKIWDFCWVRYVESRNATPIVSELSPVCGAYDAEPLRHAISGLIAESSKAGLPASQHHWVELIHHYVLQFAQPHREDERLWNLWKLVEKNLGFDWRLGDLAEKAFLSEEHLRRLCKKQLGRSPVKHLTFMRMQRAADLLAVSREKVDVIAKSLGYSSGSHFSKAFTKWAGMRPSEYREGRNNS